MTSTNCRACGSSRLDDVLDLGEQYLSDFRDDDELPPRFPLRLQLCRACLLVQLADTTPRELMYHDGYGFYSGVNEGIRNDLASVIDQALAYRPNAANWLDIACNDGTLLSYVPERIYRVGVDPVAKFEPLSCKHADEIIVGYFDPWQHRHTDIPAIPVTKFDVISSISVFYDLPDPDLFVEMVRSVLADNGIWVIQQNYLLAMVNNNSIDNICHEHLTYWSLSALMRLLHDHELRVISVQTSDINGGSIRTLVSHNRSYYQTDSTVERQLHAENKARLGDPLTYQAFATRARAELDALTTLVHRINAREQQVWIYAASTRGATIWQAAGITVEDCPYAVERNPDKVGKIFSAVGCTIVGEDVARAMRPDYMLVGPWWFRDQIIERESQYLRLGGRLIFPLPHLEIVGRGGQTLDQW
jgi:NDP-4-keto-2,6-dideoxyhexose 3-C-methyltransferase